MVICADGPIHIGSDSKAFVDKANALINNVNKGKRFKKHWSLMNDGDLWEHLALAIQAKGAHAIKVSWVKGHAGEKHIKAGISNPFKKAGNDRADANADEGVKWYGGDLLKAASHIHERHSHYANFMFKVVKHIVEGYIIHRQLSDIKKAEEAEAASSADPGKLYEKLSYAKLGDARLLNAVSSIQCFAAYAKKPAAKNMEHFLSNLQVVPRDDHDDRSITWLELYILYRIRGGIKPIPDSTRIAFGRATADKQIAAFKRLVRGLVSRVLDEQGDAKLFKPCKSKPSELAGVGILGKIAALNFNVVVTQAEQDTIAMTMSSLIRSVSIKKHKGFINGTIKLIPHELKLKGKAGWDSAIPTMIASNEEDTSWAQMFEAGQIVPAGCAMFFHCPSCSKVESSQRGTFQREDLDVKLKCGFCLKSNPVKSWKCQCGTQWHSCVEHRGGYVLMPTGEHPLTGQLLKGQPSKPPGSQRCRPRGIKRSLSADASYRRGVKLAKMVKSTKGLKRNKDIFLDEVQGVSKRPTLLWPILKGRFGGASSSTS